MNDNPGDNTGDSNIQQQDLISDDVANAITSAINGEEMSGSAAPAKTVKPVPQAPVHDNHQPQSSPAEPKAPEPEPIQQPPEPKPKPTATATESAASDRGSGNVSELYDIKQDALKKLSPLVQHLDQGPEEKFETLIMMLRASDDPALIRPVYEAAQAIEDDKKRAQALLDVVNEVNYLTRPEASE